MAAFSGIVAAFSSAIASCFGSAPTGVFLGSVCCQRSQKRQVKGHSAPVRYTVSVSRSAEWTPRSISQSCPIGSQGLCFGLAVRAARISLRSRMVLFKRVGIRSDCDRCLLFRRTYLLPVFRIRHLGIGASEISAFPHRDVGGYRLRPRPPSSCRAFRASHGSIWRRGLLPTQRLLPGRQRARRSQTHNAVPADTRGHNLDSTRRYMYVSA